VESGALGIDVIDFDPPAKASWIDSSTLWGTTTIDGVFSQTHSYVFLNNNTAFASLSVIDLITSSRQTNYIAKMTRMDETEWIAAVEQTYKDYNIMEEDKIPVPFKDFSMDPEWYPAEKEWCGGVGSDPACVESPFQEPDAKLKTGPLVGFVILGLALFCVPMYGLYRYRLGQQVRRIKTCFIQGIAKNINIAPTPGALTHEKLLEEFQHMDKDNGGTIEKAELKQWMDEGKVGKISDSDFNVLWSALDIDGSGSVDFIEFCTFLSGCGEAFDEVYNHQQTMSKEQKLKFASQRFSTRSLANNGCISNDIEDNS
jgi:Ca2+-binding EF-hand superfamily protein